MALAKELPLEQQTTNQIAGVLTLQDLSKIYLEFCRGLPAEAIQRTKGKETRKGYDTDGYGYQWCIDLLNEVAGLGHWRIVSSEAFCESGEYASGRKSYEVGYDVTIQLGNWIPTGFEILAETPCTPGGHISTSRSDARKGALTNAIKKAIAFFGIGAAAYRGELDDDNLPPEGRAKKDNTIGLVLPGPGRDSATLQTLPGQAKEGNKKQSSGQSRVNPQKSTVKTSQNMDQAKGQHEGDPFWNTIDNIEPPPTRVASQGNGRRRLF